VTVCHGLNMTNKELVINMLTELSTKEISESADPETFNEHIDVARCGGNIASPFEIGSQNRESCCNATECQKQSANKSAEYEIVIGIVCFILGFIVGSLYHKCIEEKELEIRFGDEYKDHPRAGGERGRRD
jgi:hypothetical protein